MVGHDLKDQLNQFEKLDPVIQLLLKSSSDPIIVLDLNFLIQALNSQAENILKLDCKTDCNSNFFELCQQANKSLSPKQSTIETQIKTQQLTTLEIHTDQQKSIWQLCQQTNLIDQSQVIILIGKTPESNLTELQQENKLLQSYLDSFLDSLPGSIYWKDRDGIFLGCNQFVADMAGVANPSEVIGKSDFELCWSDQAEEIRQADQAIMQGSKTKTIEEIVPLANGQEIIMLSNKTPLRDQDGKVIGVLGMSLDITKQKQLEHDLQIAKQQAYAAIKAKSEFLACISHDLRTPLNGILGAAQLLQLAPRLNIEQKSLIEAQIKSSTQLKGIIEDILFLAKLEANKLEFKTEKINLYQLAKETLYNLQYLAKENNVELISTYADDVPHYVLTDHKRISQILMNFLGNAIKFTKDGTVLLAFEKQMEDANNIKVEIIVEDTGIGIPKNQVSNVFEKFSQAKSSYHSEYEGTGLGLSIVQHLVESMDGEVGVNSQENHGSTFFCSVTLGKCSQVNRIIEWQENNPDYKIIVIDDLQSSLADEFEQFLQQHVTYINADQQLPTINPLETKYCLVFINEKISDLSAITEKVHAIYGVTPACILYGDASHCSVDFMKKNHINFYLRKQSNEDRLLQVLQSAKEYCAEKQAHPDVAVSDHTQMYVLLVEDHPINQKIQGLMLKSSGCNYDIAGSGKEAIELCQKNNYQLILMDLGLPDQSGAECTKIIREYSNTPIVALTAHVAQEDREKCLSAGMCDFLSKPLNFAALRKILLKWID